MKLLTHSKKMDPLEDGRLFAAGNLEKLKSPTKTGSPLKSASSVSKRSPGQHIVRPVAQAAGDDISRRFEEFYRASPMPKVS